MIFERQLSEQNPPYFLVVAFLQYPEDESKFTCVRFGVEKKRQYEMLQEILQDFDVIEEIRVEIGGVKFSELYPHLRVKPAAFSKYSHLFEKAKPLPAAGTYS